MKFFCHLPFTKQSVMFDTNKDVTFSVIYASNLIESRGLREIHRNWTSTDR